MPSIRSLIVLTLGAYASGGCAPFSSCPEDEIPPRDPFEFEDQAINIEAYNQFAKGPQGNGIEWDALGELSQCEAACEFLLDARFSYFYAPTAEIEDCMFTANDDGEQAGTVSCSGTILMYFCEGRRPVDEEVLGTDRAGAQGHLDACAILESLSVEAFEELAEQLTAFGAPASLIRRCLEAAGDERRHALALARLGAAPPVAERTVAEHEGARRGHGLLEVALHNAREGCAAETWAALLAEHRARFAEAPAYREAYATIALDEAGHADLAHALHRWFLSRLRGDERALLETTYARALASLPARAARQATSVSPAVRAEFGLPEPRFAARMARDFAVRLLRQAA